MFKCQGSNSSPEMQDNKVKNLVFTPFCPHCSKTNAHGSSFLPFSALVQEHKHNIKVSSCCMGGRFMLNQNDLSARQEDCVHSRDLSSRDLLLILLLCNGKDSVLTSDRAEHLLSPEM